MHTLKRVGVVMALALSCLAAPAGVHAATLQDGDGNVVPVGATAELVSGEVYFDGPFNWSCTASTLTASVEANGPTEVRARITGSSWGGCGVNPAAGHYGPGKWILRTSDTSNPFAGRVDAVDITWGNACRYAGNIVDTAVGGPSGSTVEWVNGSPSQLRMINAGALTGSPLFPCFAMRIDGSWALATDWQLT